MSVSITPVVSIPITREQMEEMTPTSFQWAIQQYTRYHNRLDERETLLGEKHPVEDRLSLEAYLAQERDFLPDDMLSAIISHARQAIDDAEPSIRTEPRRCADPSCVIATYAGRMVCERNGEPPKCYVQAIETLKLFATVRGLRGPCLTTDTNAV